MMFRYTNMRQISCKISKLTAGGHDTPSRTPSSLRKGIFLPHTNPAHSPLLYTVHISAAYTVSAHRTCLQSLHLPNKISQFCLASRM